ncbi:MAG: hypothetical protein GY797_22125, partial [Deltaproteobacteria bacterium]|nr:hypothetical protein [Deltaproteobacteria bacterium]
MDAFGKILVFVFEKIAGKVIETKLDQKKRSCQIFLRLHDSIESISELYHSGLRDYRRLKFEYASGKFVAPSWPMKFVNQGKDVSQEFCDAYQQAAFVISVFDSRLRDMLIEISRCKGGSLSTVTLLKDLNVFKLSWEKNDAFLEFTEPLHDFQQTD